MVSAALGIFATSLGLCLALTPLVRLLAARVGLVDKPDHRRKLHAKVTPVGGGIAVLLASLGGTAVGFLVSSPWRTQLLEQWVPLLGLLTAAVFICGVGLLDDRGWLRGRHKLLGQTAAVAIVISFGLVVRDVHLFGWQIELGLLSVPFTALLLLGAINSLNLLDGMDGMLSTVGIIVSLGIAGMAAMGDKGMAAAVALALAGALLGFLRYNRPPASIFLGDTGSMLIGLTIGVLAVHSSLKGPATVALAAPLAALVLPITDTAAAILRRRLTGRSIYTTDRGHLHHCLLRRGLSNWGALGWVSLLCMLAVGGALASLAFNNEAIALIGALTVVGILVGMRLFGYGELLLVKQRCLGFLASLFKLRRADKPVESEVRLQGSADWTAVWASVTAQATQLNLRRLCLDVNAPALHEEYHAIWQCRGREETENPSVWTAEMPLMLGGQAVGRLAVTGYRDDQPVWAKIATLAKLMEDVETVLAAHASRTPHPALPEPRLRLPRKPLVEGRFAGYNTPS